MTKSLAGRVSDLLPLWRVQDNTLLTKDGDPVAVVALDGRDFEGLSDLEREAHVHQVANLLRTLDMSTRLYHYVSKTKRGALHDAATYDIRVHVAIVVDARAKAVHRSLWSNRRALIGAAIATAMHTLAAQVRLVTSRLEAFGPTVLDPSAAFGVLAELVNGPDTTARLVKPDDLDDQLAEVPIDCSLEQLRIGGVPVQVLTMKQPPRATFPLMLEGLYGLDGEFVCCLEWQRIDAMSITRQIEMRLLHNRNYEKRRMKAENAQLAAAGNAMALEGHAFGQCSLTMAVRGEQAARLAADAQRLLATHDGAFVRETYNALHAWAAMLPGNHEMNIRRRPLLDVNAADLACLFGVASASPRAITTFRTQQGTAFQFSLHVEDVGHTIMLGVPGSGKTTLMQVIADAAATVHNPRIIIFDLGHGYRTLAARLGGRYASFTPRLPALNPFGFEPTPEHLYFLQAFCTVLAEGIDGTRLSDGLRSELYDSISNLYVLDRSMHRLGELVPTLPPELQLRFRPWVAEGMYAHVFDHEHDDLTVHDCQVFEFDGLEDQPQLLAPLLFYVLHRVSSHVRAERMTLCLMDEAWRFMAHPMLRDYVKAALKTWRKHNGVMVMASQALEDFAAVDLLQTAVESCPTVLLLANPLRDRARYTTAFDLNARELSMLADLRRGQVFMKRPGLSKIFDVVPIEEVVTA